MAIVGEQHLTLPIHHQRKGQLMALVFRGGIALLPGLLDNTHALQRVAAQHSLLLGNLEVIVQRALCVANQLKGQRAFGRNPGNGLRPGTHHTGQSDAAQRIDGLQILGDEMPGDGMPEVGQKHHEHRAILLQKAGKALLGLVGGVVGKRRELVPGL